VRVVQTKVVGVAAMIDGVSANGGDEERLTRRGLTDLAHRPLAIIALGALLAGAPAWARSDHGSVIAAGAHHTCALSRAGAVQCWGENAHGELGNGTSINSSPLVAVSGLTAYTGRGVAGPTEGPLSLWAFGEPL
jgi:hypothetical protein